MYVVFIVINVCKLLHVRRPTSSPRAVWNPCKINIALKINFCLNRGSYMSTHYYTSWGKAIKCEACQEISSLFRTEFNKFNNIGARMLVSIFHMTFKLF